MYIGLLIAALQGVAAGASAEPPPDTLALAPDSAALSSAYEDDAARELVRRARGRHGVIDASVFHYTTTSRQRLTVGLRALRRDRILYRREGASTIEWWRDRPGRVVVHGAREAVPVALPGLRVPDDAGDWARDFVPRPGDDRLWVNPIGDGFAWHPLVEGGEALYRYATGGTTTIRLPDGREVRLVELRVTPRKRDIRVVTGSFWIELENHAVVRAVFRPARDFDVERDLCAIDRCSEDDPEDVPDLLKPVRFDIRYVAVDYGLWELRWWMPRSMAFEGSLRLGAARFPISMEILYSDYTVAADRHGLPSLPPLTLGMAGDPFAETRTYVPPMKIVMPADPDALLESPYLPESFYSAGEVMLSESEVRELGERTGALPAPPWEVERPTFSPFWRPGSGLVRYNRVEGLSAGARVEWDLGRLRLDLTGRLGHADLAPRAELGIELPGDRRTWRAAGYHRLAAADPLARPFGIGNSLTAILLGRDDGMYYAASGAEVRLEPADDGGAYELRLYAERQSAVERETHWSLPRLAGAAGFRPNIRADEADQVGLAARLRLDRGLNPTGPRWGADLDVKAETGSFTFLRPGLTVRGAVPLARRTLGAVELAAGTTLAPDSSAAAAPLQSHWFLGGPTSLRGLDGGEIHGRDYLRGRVEAATAFPAARAVLFSDAGWAGRFDRWTPDDVAVSAGVGGSVLDGLVRIDLARAIRSVERWRLALYIDALF